jgi:hypothetical protein
LNPQGSSQAAQVTFALGHYSMTGYVTGVNPQSRTATIAFAGSNVISLGSAMASFGQGRALGTAISQQTGALPPVTVNFGWTQTVNY